MDTQCLAVAIPPRELKISAVRKRTDTPVVRAEIISWFIIHYCHLTSPLTRQVLSDLRDTIIRVSDPVPRQGNNGSVEVEPKLLVQKSLALYVALFKQGFRVDGGANCKIDTNLNTQLLRFHFVSPEFTQANMASRTAFIGSLLTTSD